MKTYRPVSVLAATLVVASSFAVSASAATYRSANGYTIASPAGWTTSKGSAGTEVVFMSPTRENINVVSQPVPKGTTLDAARSQTILLLRRMMTHYKVLGQGNTTLGGQRGLTLISGYTLNQPPVKLHAYQAFSIHNGRLFVFTCTAREATYSRYAKTFLASLASVKWSK